MTPCIEDDKAWKRLKAVISEVIYNHDFPTEAGHEDDNGDCEIFRLFKKIEDEF